MPCVVYAEWRNYVDYAEFRYTECCYAECRYTECCYAECRYAECIILNVVMPSVAHYGNRPTSKY
jgi:hypothetical protein